MELWIRSQDKEKLIKTNWLNIYKDELDYLENTECNVNKKWVLENDGTDLGRYKTKERALEVLDEIQDLLQNAYVGNLGRIVYEMPQE